jgi:hypothetical protein
MTPQSANNTEKLSILMDEYKLHKQEALHHLDFLYKQSSFMQLFGIVLLSLATLIYGNPKTLSLSELPMPLRVSGLVGAALLLFYLASTVATASYSLVIGRRRMAQLEYQINKIACQEVLSYETDLQGRFHENFVLIDGTLTPFAWAASWRIALFGGASLCLAFLSFEVMSDAYATIYTATVVYFAYHLVKNYSFFFTSYGNEVINKTLDDPPVTQSRPFGHLAYHLTNLLVFVVFCVIFFGDTGHFNDPISSSVERAVLGLGEYADWQIAAAILVYSFVCAIGFPAPSEATLLLVPHVGPVTVYAASAIGKGLGSVALAMFVYYSLHRKGRFFDRFHSYRMRVQLSWVGLKLNRWLKTIYFLCQAIPWGPAKSSTIFYSSYAGLSKWAVGVIFIISAVGMIFRMLLVSLLF